jgi:GntR family transcriptional regulator
MTTPLLAVNPSDPLPLYAQLDRGIRSAIATGRLGPGSQLPTVRQLAVELRINANTVAGVYTDLERAGLLEARRGVGTFVRRELPESALTRRDRERELRALADRLLAEAAAAGYGADELIKHLVGRTRKERVR